MAQGNQPGHAQNDPAITSDLNNEPKPPLSLAGKFGTLASL
jgi:hypothetical protein